MVQNPSGHPDLPDSACPGKLIKVRMAIRMAADVVPFILHAPHDMRVLLGGSPHHKKRRLHRVISKDVQYPWGIDWIRTVIDGYGNLGPVPIPMLKQLFAGKGTEQGSLNQRAAFRLVPLCAVRTIFAPQIGITIVFCYVFLGVKTRNRLLSPLLR